MEPKISVIVTAHDRRDYILEAIDSLLIQTLPRSLFEIIVVKNFRDPIIDEKLENAGSKCIYTEVVELGGKISAAIKASSGNILCFLEDDDKFENNKLEAVCRMFEEDDTLFYYHNDHFTIDHAGVETTASYRKVTAKRLILKSDSGVYDKFYRFFRLAPDFNLSSISIRKELLLGRLEDLKRISIGVDSFLLHSALVSKKSLAADDNKLTYFRVHSDSVTHRTGTYEQFMTNTKKYFADHKRCFEIILEVANNRKTDEIVKLRLSESQVGVIMCDLLDDRRAMLKQWVSFLRHSVKARSGVYTALLGLGLLYLVSPSRARKLFYVGWTRYLHSFNVP